MDVVWALDLFGYTAWRQSCNLQNVGRGVTGFDPLVIKACLSHRINVKLRAAYMRGELDKRRRLIVRLAEFLHRQRCAAGNIQSGDVAQLGAEVY